MIERPATRRPITAAEIEAGRSPGGGFTEGRLRSWGVGRPLKAGWQRRLLARGVPLSCPVPEGFVPPLDEALVPLNPLLAFSSVPRIGLPEDALAIFADGSCRGRRGGWGFAAYRGLEEVHSACGGVPAATNNRMELAAIVAALRWLDPRDAAVVWTDSQYAARGVLEWRHGWRKADWRRSQGAEWANADLWDELFALLATRTADVRWVRGHAETAGNRRADALAAIGRGLR